MLSPWIFNLRHLASVAAVVSRGSVSAAAGTVHLTQPAVTQAIARVDFDSLYGRIRFNAVGQISLPQTVVQVQKGKLVPVYGPKGAMEKALYPMPAWSKR